MQSRELIKSNGGYRIERITDPSDGFESFEVVDDWGNCVDKLETIEEAEAVLEAFAG
ncbi:MAG: hypothetical protein KDG50_10795 [Chromatiales bacterium]|nr:hypothetical protein [Chromatiales bacterium]